MCVCMGVSLVSQAFGELDADLGCEARFDFDCLLHFNSPQKTSLLPLNLGFSGLVMPCPRSRSGFPSAVNSELASRGGVAVLSPNRSISSVHSEIQCA